MSKHMLGLLGTQTSSFGQSTRLVADGARVEMAEADAKLGRRTRAWGAGVRQCSPAPGTIWALVGDVYIY